MKPLLAGMAFALAVVAAFARSADDAVSFEVASVRRSQVLEGGRMMPQPGGRLKW